MMMKNQMNFYLPEVNPKATRKAVERELEKYRDLLVTLPVDCSPKITASYSLIPPSNTNEFHSKTEEAAIERADFERYRDNYFKKIHAAVEALKPDEKFIIVNRYMQQVTGYDPDIWMDLGIGKTMYYELKGKAMLRLAFGLKIEVYKKRNEVKSA
jgi:ArpU family phage transcriptional regulator